MEKDAILKNYEYVFVDRSAKHSWLLKDDEEIKRMHESGEIKDGDLIIKINAENLRLARQRNYIELL